MRQPYPVLAAALFVAAAACSVSNQDEPPKRDTSVAAAASAASSADSARGVPAVPSDSAALAGTAGAPGAPGATSPGADSGRALPGIATGGAGGAGGAVAPTPTPAPSLGARGDTGRVRLHPAQPARGGVLFALAEQTAGQGGRADCRWAGKSLPCYEAPGGLLAIVPLPADEPAGTFPLQLGRPAVSRQVVVAEREFGREAILLDRELYSLVTRSKDVARDARAVRRVLSGETPERYWRGAWREPIGGARGRGYGVERFYYPRADSVKVINLDPGLRARASFGIDTIGSSDKVPSWRHAGVDIPAPRGSAVSSPQHGVVAEVGEYVLSGRTLLVDHGQGVYSAFFHLDTVLVRKGDVVRPGQRVGRVGSTGLSTGPHLHYGVYVHGRDVDPTSLRDLPAFARGDSAAATGATAPSRAARDTAGRRRP